MSAKEVELVTSMVIYAARCVAEGDFHMLEEFGLGREEIAALSNLSVVDLHRISRGLSGHFIKAINVDRSALWHFIEYVENEREKDRLIDTMIKADASLDMMRSLMGISDAHEYAERRKLAGFPPSGGRPASPDEETSSAIYRAWKEITERQKDGNDDLAPGDYLEIHEKTGAPLRTIWHLVCKWSAFDSGGQ